MARWMHYSGFMDSIDRHAADTLITAEQAVRDMIEEDSQNETSSGGI